MRRLIYFFSYKLGSAVYIIFSYIYSRLMFFFLSVKVSPGLKVRGRIRVRNLGEIRIGRDVRFNSGWRQNPIGSEGRLSLWTFKGGQIEIREGAGVSSSIIVSMDRVVIGRNTNIGGGCKIFDNDFHALGNSSLINKRPVIIGDDCFIGGYSIILKGVVIGDGAIVAAGSVVVCSIPPGQIWGGNPAKYISENNYR